MNGNAVKLTLHSFGAALACVTVWILGTWVKQVPAELAPAFGTIYAVAFHLLFKDKLPE